jgi:DNA-binding beta-propeller fold protein YncE
MSRTSEARRKLWWTCRRTRSSRPCISTARQECRNTTPWRGRCTNLQGQNIFAVIDPATDQVIGRYPVGKCEGNHGMALDPEHHRAFLSCEGNELMTVFDLDKHAAIAFLKMPGGPDVIKFDPGLGRIYVACYSGAVAVFHQDDPDNYRKLEDFRVQHAVHTVAVDLKTHRLYTPEQEEDGKPVARMVVYDAVTN